MQRNQNTPEYFEKVKKLAELYHFELSEEEYDGESVGRTITKRIYNAVVEVKITAGRRIITNEEGNSKSFEKSQSEESLAHIETLLKKSQQSKHRKK